MLSKEALNKLKESGLTRVHADLLKLRVEKKLLKWNSKKPACVLQVLVFPFFHPITGEPLNFEVDRILEGGVVDDKIDGKYRQPAGIPSRLYFPATNSKTWLFDEKNAENVCIFTEGPLKAARGCLEGIPVIGLNGVWNFSGKKHGLLYLPDFNLLNFKGVKTIIMYDSDVADNYQVLMAEEYLCKILLDLGAIPYISRIPPSPTGEKVGLDDFLVAGGDLKDLISKSLRDGKYRLADPFKSLNQRYAVIAQPPGVLRFSDMEILNFADFHHLEKNLNFYVPGTTKKGFVSEYWEESPLRNNVSRIVYRPGKPMDVEGCCNNWMGMGAEPLKGTVEPWHYLMDEVYFKGKDPDLRHYFECVLAYPLQNLGQKSRKGLVVIGKQGVGKSLLREFMMKIYGPANSCQFTNKEIISDFNGWVKYKQLAYGEEISLAHDPKVMEIIKESITGDYITINDKYRRTFQVEDCTNYIFNTNKRDAMKLEQCERRFFVVRIPDDSLAPQEKYSWIGDWKDNRKGASYLYQYFLDLDISDFDPKAAAPRTRDFDDLVESSESNHVTWIKNIKGNEEYLFGDRVLWEAAEVHSLYVSTTKSQVYVNTFSTELKNQGYEKLELFRSKRDGKTVSVRPFVMQPAKLNGDRPSSWGDYYERDCKYLKQLKS
jgi:hypothetical protein